MISDHNQLESSVELKPGRLRRGSRRGQTLTELALLTPFLLMLSIVAVDFGGWLYCWTEIGNAARVLANYSALGFASVGTPQGLKTSTNATTLLNAELGTLPNYSSTNPSLIICFNQNGTLQSYVGTCSSLSPAAQSDPEPSSYIAVTVDLTYTYTPFINSFNFSNLGIHLPSIPTTIHRRVVMRYI